VATRTTETSVTFRHPFALTSLDGTQPPGTYRLVVDEDEIDGLSFLAFRRTATMLHLPALASGCSNYQVFLVDAEELASALEADAKGPPSLACEIKVVGHGR
jgi:hypothetical protein